MAALSRSVSVCGPIVPPRRSGAFAYLGGMRTALIALALALAVVAGGALAQNPGSKQAAADDQSVLGNFPPRQALSGSARYPDFRGRDARFNSYRTRISTGVASGVNFAGAYRLVEIGCGTSCTFAYIVDLSNGRVGNFPLGGEDNSGMSLTYRSDSEAVVAYWTEDDRCFKQLLYWDLDQFRLLGSRVVGDRDACYGRAAAQPSSQADIGRALPVIPADPEKIWSPQFRLPAVPAQVSPTVPQKSYVRTLLNYEIEEECRKGIDGMGGAIARGEVVPSRDIPRCVKDDTESLKYLDENWTKISQNSREACLASFGSPVGKGLMMRYNILATCMGRSLQ